MSDTGTLIFKQMANILAEVGAVGKDSRNQAQGFNYRGVDAIYNAINPLLVKHRVFMTAEVVSKQRENRTNNKGTVLAFTCLRMRYRFNAEDGSFVTTEAEGEGMDSGDKSSNKAMAIAHKYALLQAFCIPTEDMPDPDGESHEVGPKGGKREPEPKSDLRQEAKQSGNGKVPAANGDRAQAARVWAEEATNMVREFSNVPALNSWVTKHSKILDAARMLAPTAHKHLFDAIEAGRKSLPPM